MRTARKDKQPEILRSCFDCDHYAACRAQNGYPLAEKNANRCALYAERSLLTQERERNIQIQDELNKDIVMLMAELEQVKRERDSFEDALRSIVFYDGHKEWLVKLTDILENTQSIVACPLDHSRWHTEEHTIWMILIGMFGDWGTSIRGGWIERNKDAAEFIRSICTDDTDKED